jgi:hypothetical protein
MPDTAALDRPAWPRMAPVHVGVCALGILGALVLQLAWLEIHAREPSASWWPIDAGAILVATGYLIATAYLHGWLASAGRRGHAQPPVETGRPNLWQALMADAMVTAYMILVLIRGPQAELYRAGLWILLPTLLTLASASSVAALLSIRRAPEGDAGPAGQPAGAFASAAHTALAVLLLLMFFGVEYIEPSTRTAGGAAAAQTGEPSRPAVRR